MRTQFTASNYDLPRAATEHAERKLKALAKYLGRAKEGSLVRVHLGKESEAHQRGRIWRADLNFELDGALYRASALEETIEAAIDRAMGELIREVRTARERRKSLMKRGGAKVKAFLQRSPA